MNFSEDVVERVAIAMVHDDGRNWKYRDESMRERWRGKARAALDEMTRLGLIATP